MSRREALQALEAQLGAPPAGLRSLSEEELRRLLEAVNTARRRQAAELQAAGEKAWGHIPWLLRAPIRKIVG